MVVHFIYSLDSCTFANTEDVGEMASPAIDEIIDLYNKIVNEITILNANKTNERTFC